MAHTILNPVYFDYNATTPVDKVVLEEMLPYFNNHFGNAASKTHAYGWVAEQAVEKARKRLAALLNCSREELVFTSGATEAINLALKGVFETYHQKGKHIVTVKTEHKAVLGVCEELEKKGAEITYLDVDRNGEIDLKVLDNSIRRDTVLVAIMYANNETGLIHPVKEIAAIIHKKESLFFCDATQAIGKFKVDVQEDGIDLLCLSGHKIYGPKGIGALYKRRKNPRVTLTPQIVGGGHENGLRAGSLNVPGIVGLGAACIMAESRMRKELLSLKKLRDLLEVELLKNDRVVINGSNVERLANTSNFLIKGIRADSLIRKLSGFAFSTGSACTSAISQPSHVLNAMGISKEDALSSIRISLGRASKKEEIIDFLAQLNKALKMELF